MNVIYMDPWDGEFVPVAPNEDVRKTMGYLLNFSQRMNLEAMVPHGELAGSGYALANTSASYGEFLVYLPSSSNGRTSVDLSSYPGMMKVEWFNPATGLTVANSFVKGGGVTQFTAPFSGDAVLYIYSRINSTFLPMTSR